eukprot:CAMPEP_0179195850 /NCGR_PEP_ID=MMETSP0796-20121207/97366_1 /TAXON_ID=73915 /ORGANISM="Pyrodinium bahamense, Strain pbaha01" /LENGTH=34 /DNA_ID= /DNA_START= /DNA_END= /DNA_ORIENTATION=
MSSSAAASAKALRKSVPPNGAGAGTLAPEKAGPR